MMKIRKDIKEFDQFKSIDIKTAEYNEDQF